MTRRSLFLTTVAIVLAIGAEAPGVHASSNANRLVYLTFNGRVALPGVTLDAGTYAFEMYDPGVTSRVVLVRDRSRARSYFLGMTNAVPRPDNVGLHSAVTFGEAARGEPRPIVAWYPPDAGYGLQFVYGR